MSLNSIKWVKVASVASSGPSCFKLMKNFQVVLLYNIIIVSMLHYWTSNTGHQPDTGTGIDRNFSYELSIFSNRMGIKWFLSPSTYFALQQCPKRLSTPSQNFFQFFSQWFSLRILPPKILIVKISFFLNFFPMIFVFFTIFQLLVMTKNSFKLASRFYTSPIDDLCDEVGG